MRVNTGFIYLSVYAVNKKNKKKRITCRCDIIHFVYRHFCYLLFIYLSIVSRAVYWIYLFYMFTPSIIYFSYVFAWLLLLFLSVFLKKNVKN